jgi:ABC-2 type transport system ATP-binding protein
VTSAGPVLLEADGLVRSFGARRAVDGLSLRIAAGEIYALVGPDGAGKTTTLRMLCGVLRPDQGTVRVAGIDMRSRPEEARGRIGYVPQRFSLYGDLTVGENIRFFAEVRGLSGDLLSKRTSEILQLVALSEFAERRADALSGGMRQKLGLAVALVHRPSLLLLDEPTGGVDPVTRQSFWALLLSLLREGSAVVITTPYLDEAARCTRVGFMDRGQLFLEGPPSEITRRLEGRLLEVAGGPRRALEQAARGDPDVESVQAFGDRVHVRTASGRVGAVEARLPDEASRNGARVTAIREIHAGLEDVFLERMESRSRPASDTADG